MQCLQLLGICTFNTSSFLNRRSRRPKKIETGLIFVQCPSCKNAVQRFEFEAENVFYDAKLDTSCTDLKTSDFKNLKKKDF